MRINLQLNFNEDVTVEEFMETIDMLNKNKYIDFNESVVIDLFKSFVTESNNKNEFYYHFIDRNSYVYEIEEKICTNKEILDFIESHEGKFVSDAFKNRIDIIKNFDRSKRIKDMIDDMSNGNIVIPTSNSHVQVLEESTNNNKEDFLESVKEKIRNDNKSFINTDIMKIDENVDPECFTDFQVNSMKLLGANSSLNGIISNTLLCFSNSDSVEEFTNKLIALNCIDKSKKNLLKQAPNIYSTKVSLLNNIILKHIKELKDIDCSVEKTLHGIGFNDKRILQLTDICFDMNEEEINKINDYLGNDYLFNPYV